MEKGISVVDHICRINCTRHISEGKFRLVVETFLFSKHVVICRRQQKRSRNNGILDCFRTIFFVTHFCFSAALGKTCSVARDEVKQCQCVSKNGSRCCAHCIATVRASDRRMAVYLCSTHFSLPKHEQAEMKENCCLRRRGNDRGSIFSLCKPQRQFI